MAYTLAVDGVSEPLRVLRYDGHEGLSELFDFRLLVHDHEDGVVTSDIVGQAATFTFKGVGETLRFVHGMVRRAEHTSQGNKTRGLRITLVPHVFRLRLRHQSRIFQAMTAPDIIEKVLSDAGFTDYQLALVESYATREYCVQYQESDWAFVARLMEEEGIHFFFEHGDGTGKLFVADSTSAHDDISGEATIKFRGSTGVLGSEEHVHRLDFGEEVRPGKVTMRDYNYLTPTVDLEASSASDAFDDLEIFEYPGWYDDGSAGTDKAKRLLEAHQAVRRTGHGQSSCPRFVPGYRFTLIDNSNDALNQTYLVTGVIHRGSEPAIEDGEVEAYGNTFRVIPSDVPFRPLRKTPRPAIHGVQTAVVVGPSGEELHTDEHGRIKIQFHWDRVAPGDETASCWVRVGQTWAGAGWGAFQLPRVGHEVIVDFIEGNPDRPIVIGSVYHASNVTPLTLPENATQSTLMSDSVQGDGHNMVRLEDKADKEEIYIHAQKDFNIEVLNDQTAKIGNDQSIEVSANKTLEVGGDHEETVDGEYTLTIGKTMTLKVEKDMTFEGAASLTEDTKKERSIVVGDKLTIECGDAKVTIEKDGKIEVEGKDITLKGTGDVKIEGDKINVKASGKLKVEGDKIDVKGSGKVKVKGSKVTMN